MDRRGPTPAVRVCVAGGRGQARPKGYAVVRVDFSISGDCLYVTCGVPQGSVCLVVYNQRNTLSVLRNSEQHNSSGRNAIDNQRNTIYEHRNTLSSLRNTIDNQRNAISVLRNSEQHNSGHRNTIEHNAEHRNTLPVLRNTIDNQRNTLPVLRNSEQHNSSGRNAIDNQRNTLSVLRNSEQHNTIEHNAIPVLRNSEQHNSSGRNTIYEHRNTLPVLRNSEQRNSGRRNTVFGAFSTCCFVGGIGGTALGVGISQAMFCIKLVRYGLMFWLPLYSVRWLGHSLTDAGTVAMAFECGGVVGSATIGLIVDRYMGGRAILTCLVAVLASTLALSVFALTSLVANSTQHCLLLALAGVGNCGPDVLLAGSVAVGIGERGGVGGAGVAGVVNGMGSLGTVLEGPIVAITVTYLGWNALMALMVAVSFIAVLVLLRAHVYVRTHTRTRSLA
ncbi:hypothetical protein Pmani_033468 [Petrolisthes manimaculis]|uniref:Uncharacterized protein n=1 Tax=Petrolisthes manimaculis TaxID=1843537 RepID=A0AAE1NPF7_9EUCA|nr:hypothetical protein Pmani_033468 [Petrolisthes manimaculis]